MKANQTLQLHTCSDTGYSHILTFCDYIKKVSTRNATPVISILKKQLTLLQTAVCPLLTPLAPFWPSCVYTTAHTVPPSPLPPTTSTVCLQNLTWQDLRTPQVTAVVTAYFV